jgi:hypothetical protein
MFQTKYHPAAGVATFLGPVYVDWPMLQSDSPEGREGNLWEVFSSAESITLFLQGEINLWEAAAP